MLSKSRRFKKPQGVMLASRHELLLMVVNLLFIQLILQPKIQFSLAQKGQTKGGSSFGFSKSSAQSSFSPEPEVKGRGSVGVPSFRQKAEVKSERPIEQQQQVIVEQQNEGTKSVEFSGRQQQISAEVKSRPIKFQKQVGQQQQQISRIQVSGHEDQQAEAAYGSMSGSPGVDFPALTSIPNTKFDCHLVPHDPGLYADESTGCQVYHLCFEGRRESFLCGVGTVFNQAILSCDFWHSAECSKSSQYYALNADYGKASAEPTGPKTQPTGSSLKAVSRQAEQSIKSPPPRETAARISGQKSSSRQQATRSWSSGFRRSALSFSQSVAAQREPKTSRVQSSRASKTSFIQQQARIEPPTKQQETTRQQSKTRATSRTRGASFVSPGQRVKMLAGAADSGASSQLMGSESSNEAQFRLLKNSSSPVELAGSKGKVLVVDDGQWRPYSKSKLRNSAPQPQAAAKKIEEPRGLSREPQAAPSFSGSGASERPAASTTTSRGPQVNSSADLSSAKAATTTTSAAPATSTERSGASSSSTDRLGSSSVEYERPEATTTAAATTTQAATSSGS